MHAPYRKNLLHFYAGDTSRAKRACAADHGGAFHDFALEYCLASGGGDQVQLLPGTLAGHRLGAAVEPVGLEVVVVPAGGVAGLAGEHLPARALRVGRVGDHAPARRPDRAVGVVGVVGDLAHGLLRPAGAQAAVEQPPQQRVGLAERVRELHLVDPAPAPGLRVGAEALAEVVEGAAQRLQHELVPGAADQLLVAFLPEQHQVRVPAPGRGDVRGEAVVGAVEPAPVSYTHLRAHETVLALV